MATITEWTPAKQKKFDAKLAKMPAVIRRMAEKHPPSKLYRLKESRDRVLIETYNDDGTMNVSVTGQYNYTAFDRDVFGVNPDDLEECDLPGPDEKLGAVLTTQEDIAAYMDDIRQRVLAARKRKVTPSNN